MALDTSRFSDPPFLLVLSPDFVIGNSSTLKKLNFILFIGESSGCNALNCHRLNPE